MRNDELVSDRTEPQYQIRCSFLHGGIAEALPLFHGILQVLRKTYTKYKVLMETQNRQKKKGGNIYVRYD